jgi:hypothetical protein
MIEKTELNTPMMDLMRYFFNTLNEKHKRLYAGLEAMRLGYYGVQAVSKKYGIHPHTVRRGKKELSSGNIEEGNDIRKAGGGRKKKF